jgi:hypothetical protein
MQARSVFPERQEPESLDTVELASSRILSMTRASVNDLSLNRPSLVRLNFMNDLTACSAPLLFQGTPS